MGEKLIKEWKADIKPIDNLGNFVKIVGRNKGFIAWFLSLLKIDPIIAMYVNLTYLEFTKTSLSGLVTRYVNLNSISSTYYSYYKPWKQAIGVFILIMLIVIGIGTEFFTNKHLNTVLFAMLLAFLCSIAYYGYNKTFTLGFIESSGVVNSIRFKRSVIENIEINQEQAKKVCYIIQKLIDFRTKR